MNNILVVAAFFSLAFDHKGDEGGGWLIYLFTISAIFFASLVFVFSGFPKYRNKRELVVGFLIFAPLLFSGVPLIFGELQFDSFARAAIPYFLMVLMYHVLLTRTLSDLEFISKGLFVSGFLSVLFSVFFGFFYSGLSVVEIRYQIISPYTAAVLAFAVPDYFYKNKFSYLSVLGVFCVLVVAAMSVTRTFALSILISLLVGCYLSQRYGSGLVRRLPVSAFVGLFLCVSFIGYLYSPDVFDRWVERAIFSSGDIGFDPTTLTREAEILAQLDAVAENSFTLIFGKGIGGAYVWSDVFNTLLRGYVGDVELLGEYTYVGHNFWVYSLFAGGLLSFLFVPSVFLYGVYSSFTLSVASNKNMLYQYVALASVIFFVYSLVFTIGGNPLGSRVGGVLIGTFLGINALLVRE